jgi:hypothetical protein
MRTPSVVVPLAMIALATYAQMQTHKEQTIVDASGHLRVPDNYRTTYQFLGTWGIAADAGQGSKEIHNVYASPGTIAAYRKSDTFPTALCW